MGTTGIILNVAPSSRVMTTSSPLATSSINSASRPAASFSFTVCMTLSHPTSSVIVEESIRAHGLICYLSQGDLCGRTPPVSSGLPATSLGKPKKRVGWAVCSNGWLDYAKVAGLPCRRDPIATLILEVHCRRFKRFFRSAVERPIVKHTWLIFLVTVGVEGKRPGGFVPKVTQPA